MKTKKGEAAAWIDPVSGLVGELVVACIFLKRIRLFAPKKVVILYPYCYDSANNCSVVVFGNQYTALSFFAQLLALLLFPILVFFHAITGYLPLEEKVNSGKQLSEDEKKNYLRYNLSLHVLYGLLYFISAFWLLLSLG